MTDAIVPTLLITLLILLNGLFVAAEFAIVGAPRPAIASRASQGDRRARLAQSLLEDPQAQDRFIATAQLGITLASLGLGMYGEHLLAQWLGDQFESLGAGRWIAAHTLGSILAIAILTYFHIVVGEMVPKSIALQRAERTLLWIAPVMRVVQLVTFPMVFALNGIGNGVLRLLGVRRDTRTAEHYQTPDELAYVVREAQAGGLIQNSVARVVAELLDFGELTAGEIMVPRVRVVALPLGSTTDDLRRILRDRPFTRYPVCDGTLDNMVGMVHVKDLLRLLHTNTALQQDVVRTIPYVPETASVDHLMTAMRTAQVQMAVVLDEHGGTAGIVTTEDLFEEVVGDVSDDGGGVAEVRRDGDGTVFCAGATRLETFGDALGVEVINDAVDTVSGLVLALLGRPPRVGDVVHFDGVRIEVTRVAGLGVDEVRAQVEPPSRSVGTP